MSLRACVLGILLVGLPSASLSAQDIPLEVVGKITAVAEARFPDSMLRKAYVDREMTAYRFLAAYAPAGVPQDRLARVRAGLEARFPKDYSTQQQLLVMQVESYRFLDTFHPAGISTNDLDQIRAQSRKHNEDDYSIQQILVQQQVESYIILSTYVPPQGLPSDALADIKHSIARKYPHDYSMQRTLLEEEVAGYFEPKARR
jgi:hypothetical protein